MGHKGVSKRKPKKSRSNSNDDGNSSNIRSGESASIPSLIKNNQMPLHKGGANLAAESNKRNKKGK